MYRAFTTPARGSTVQRPALAGQYGRVLEVTERETLRVRWEEGEEEEVTPSKLEALPVPGAGPNAKAGWTLLDYLSALLSGETFHGALPSVQVRDVQLQVLEFLFRVPGVVAGHEPPKASVEARSYPVLESLLRFDTGLLVQALEGVWFVESQDASPWRKVVEQGMLVKADPALPRFSLSRDQVVAVLNAKLRLTEFKPHEAALTAARAWPQYEKLVVYLKLLARSVSRDVIETNKFGKGGKDGSPFVKRVFAHLLHACPDESERAQRGAIVEDMLARAFRADSGAWPDLRDVEGHVKVEELTVLKQQAESAGFTRLQIFLLEYGRQYAEALRTYLLPRGGQCGNDMFDFIDRTLDEPQQGEVVEPLRQAVLRNLGALVTIDPQRTALLANRHFLREQEEILRSLAPAPESQFRFMSGLLAAAEASAQARDEDADLLLANAGSSAEEGEDAALPKIISSNVALYVQLLCRHHPTGVHDFLRTYAEALKTREGTLVEIVEEHRTGGETCELDSALIYLYSRSGVGRFTDALSLLFRGLAVHMRKLRQHIVHTARQGDSGAQVSGLEQGNVSGMLSTFSPLDAKSPFETSGQLSFATSRRGHSRVLDDERSVRSMQSEHVETLLDWIPKTVLTGCEEGRRVTHLIDVGVAICVDSIRGGGGEDASSVAQVWFGLLERFLRPKKLLAQLQSADLTWRCTGAAAAAALIVVATPQFPPSGTPRTVPASVTPPLRPLCDATEVDPHFNELDELERRERPVAKARPPTLAERKPSAKLQEKPWVELTQPLTVDGLAVCKRMHSVYAHYISSILLKMVTDGKTGVLAEPLKRAAEAASEWQDGKKGREHYADARRLLCESSLSMEKIILGKIREDHADEPFADFRDVIHMILQNIRTGRDLQRASYECHLADHFVLEKRALAAARAAVLPRAMCGRHRLEAPPCSKCGVRIDGGQGVVAVGQVTIHASCAETQGGQRARPPPAARRLKRLDDRLSKLRTRIDVQPDIRTWVLQGRRPHSLSLVAQLNTAPLESAFEPPEMLGVLSPDVLDCLADQDEAVNDAFETLLVDAVDAMDRARDPVVPADPGRLPAYHFSLAQAGK
eukprot:Hpha_TRINITY_DN322_c0_g1::TRINITY_DN322_c0_g1_i2::g.112830::m.112830